MEKNRIQKTGHKRLMTFVLFLLTVCILLPVTARKTEAAVQGFRVLNGNTYYYVNGKKQVGLHTIKGTTYQFDSKGRMITGWTKDSKGRMRYFYKGSGAMATGWVTSSNGQKRYFYKGSGYMATGWVASSNGQKRYFYKGSGYMATGWVKNGSTARYFNTKNGYMYTGLKKIGNYYYYFDTKSGYRFQSGFKKVGESTYYFQASTGRAKTGWITVSNKKYYFKSNGMMVANTSLTLNGVSYTFNKDGVLSPTSTFPYEISGNNVIITDPNGRKYPLVKEYLEHPGIADGRISDLEILAAVAECEAGNQGLVGMEAVALCILNRTIAESKEFPSTVRGVVYHGTSFPQYSVVRNGTLVRRLQQGKWDNKTLAMQAAKNAMQMIEDYVTKGKSRTLEGFKKKDFDYMYFMMESAFWKQNLDFGRLDYYLYVSPIADTHMFFVDWISPRR